MKISALANDLGLKVSELRELMSEEDLGVDPQVDELTEEEAAKIKDFLGEDNLGKGGEDDLLDDTAEYYEEMEKQRQERMMKKGGKKKKDETKKEEKGGGASGVKGGVVELPDTITVKELAEKTGVLVVKIIGTLMKNGVVATINQPIDFETVMLVSDDLGIKVKRRHKAGRAEDLLARDLKSLIQEDDASVLEKRPAIVTVMGHVDHGKTSILDVVRETAVAKGEHGGITQHIGAYQAEYKGEKITFLDTPGHEAFTEMRARGAQVTDVAVLVVAANEGVKPQTIESISHAKEAGVKIVVAINKMDLPEANPDKVKGELAEHGLQAEDWGGDVPMVPVSAHKKTGIDDLLENILVVAELLELKANPNRPAVATVIETHLDKALGPVATVVVNAGSLMKGNNFVVGEVFGRVKRMMSYNGEEVEKATPAMPVQIAGFGGGPRVGDILQVTGSEAEARRRALEVGELRKMEMEGGGMTGMSQIISAIQAGKLKELKVVLKADTRGSLEAVSSSLVGIKHDEVTVRVIHAGVGGVTKTDVMMAEASGAVLVGFNVKVDSLVEEWAKREGVEVLIYTVIYKLIEDMKKLLAGLLEPEEVVVEVGVMEVLQVFLSKKQEMIVGGKVVKGKAKNHMQVRIKRGEEEIGEGEVTSLQREKDSVGEVQEGKECGVRVRTGLKLEEGDRLEFYEIEKKIRTL